MTEENASLKMAIEAIRADERDSAWAKGYAACREAQRVELEWQRAEIERLRAALEEIISWHSSELEDDQVCAETLRVAKAALVDEQSAREREEAETATVSSEGK